MKAQRRVERHRHEGQGLARQVPECDHALVVREVRPRVRNRQVSVALEAAGPEGPDMAEENVAPATFEVPIVAEKK